MSFGRRLKEIITKKGISISALAMEMEVSRTAITGWTNDEGISTSHLIRLALTLNLSMDWLVLGQGEPNLLGAKHLSISEWKLIQLLRSVNPASCAYLNQFVGSAFENLLTSTLDNHVKHYQIFKDCSAPFFIMNDVGYIKHHNHSFKKMIMEICGEVKKEMNLVDAATNHHKTKVIELLNKLRNGLTIENESFSINCQNKGQQKEAGHNIMINAIEIKKGFMVGDYFCLVNKIDQ